MPTQIYKLQNGSRVSGVTTILSGNLGWDTQMLIAWARKTAMAGSDPNVIRDQAADTGTLAHYVVECYVKNQRPIFEDKYTSEQKVAATNCIKGFKAWMNKYNPTFVDSELSLISEQYGYGGTIDIVSRVNNMLIINDIKTSNFVSPKMIIQVAAYKKLYEENKPDKICGCEIIQLDKEKPGYKLYKIDNDLLELGWQAFEKLIYLHNIKKEFKLPLTDEGVLINE